jgi:hypothetical protein
MYVCMCVYSYITSDEVLEQLFTADAPFRFDDLPASHHRGICPFKYSSRLFLIIFSSLIFVLYMVVMSTSLVSLMPNEVHFTLDN